MYVVFPQLDKKCKLYELIFSYSHVFCGALYEKTEVLTSVIL